MNSQFFTYLFIIPLFLVTACAQSSKTSFPSPADYDLNKPEKFIMSDALHEISGISFFEGDPSVIYAEQDELGELYFFKLGDAKIQKYKFGKKGDYEDVAICKGFVVMLRSDGVFFTFPFKKSYEKEEEETHEWQGLLPKGEYESMAVGPDNKLYVLCKDSKADSKKKAISGYILQVGMDGSVHFETDFTIPYSQIKSFAKLKNKNFYPSAMGWNTKRKEWYVVASINKLLVVTDGQWKVKAAYPLNPDLFNQPEGLAFDQFHNLYISNEGGTKSNSATLLKFEIKP
ncbi:hypothetical protein SAMN05216436_11196 [bacterium A37T11]|nr:hypothetical protein SAMN05216436_11196 [bacterium A37T11]